MVPEIEQYAHHYAGFPLQNHDWCSVRRCASHSPNMGLRMLIAHDLPVADLWGQARHGPSATIYKAILLGNDEHPEQLVQLCICKDWGRSLDPDKSKWNSQLSHFHREWCEPIVPYVTGRRGRRS